MNPEEILHKLLEKWEQLQKKIARLIATFRRTVEFLGQLAAGAVEQAVAFWNEKVVPALEQLFQWWADYSGFLGSPLAMFSAAGQWREQVGAPASSRAGFASAGQVTVDDNWIGAAADGYRQRLSQQEAAINGIQSQFAEVIAVALTKVGAGIILWWLATISAVGTLILAAAVATGETVSIAGLPAMPPTLLVAIGACLTSLLEGVATLTVLVLNSKGDLDGAHTNLSAYPGGAWPAF